MNNEESDESADESAVLTALILTWSAKAVEGVEVKARKVSSKKDSMMLVWCFLLVARVNRSLAWRPGRAAVAFVLYLGGFV